MKKLIVITALIASILYGCVKYTPPIYEPQPESQQIEQPSTQPQTYKAESEPEKIVEPSDIEKTVNETFPDRIKIASFNIQIFGKSKREKEDVMQALEKIVRNFDIVAVQEFRDKTQTTLPYFVDRINSMEGDEYAYVGSPRLGRTTSKEEYAFIYNTQTVKFRDISYIYDDTSDIFEREPFIAAFSSGNFDYTLVNIHTKPDDAEKEIQALVDIVKDADEHVPDDSDVIVLGDFNADGSYFSETITTGFRDYSYTWVIPDTADTTTKATVYTYDRIVFRNAYTSEDFAKEWAVFDFKERYGLTQELTEKVSDHYPVWALFYTDRDSD